MTSKNKRYEEKQKEKGLKKITIWIPAGMESEFYMLSSACCKYRSLTFDMLRDTDTGRYVSLERI